MKDEYSLELLMGNEYEKGIKEGIDKEKKENALKMRAAGLELALIAKITGLSEDELHHLDT